jgi:hypothetical protein
MSLHNNGSYSILACVFVAAGMCLQSRCLAMNVYSDFMSQYIWRENKNREYIAWVRVSQYIEKELFFIMLQCIILNSSQNNFGSDFFHASIMEQNGNSRTNLRNFELSEPNITN